MPNHIVNRVTSPDMDKLRKLLLNEKGEVDFNKITKMPKDLDIESGSCSFRFENIYDDNDKRILRNKVNGALEKLYSNLDKKTSRDVFVEKVMKHRTTKALLVELLSFEGKLDNITKKNIETYVSGFFNLKRHNSIDWYDWRRKHWGTKWNAYETLVTERYIEFTTAWATPEALLRKLSKKIPITVAYADEDVGGDNVGIIEYVNGVKTVMQQSYDSVALACFLHYRSADDYGNDDEFVTDERIKQAGEELFKNNLD